MPKIYPMLKLQLEEIRKTRKTLLHTKKALVRFVDGCSADNATLLSMITLQTPFTTRKSLLFERHQLSEREDVSFNKKFVPFLRGLIAHMGDASIDHLLEYLVRIYNVDTYNTDELLFLLLPFQRYIGQIQVLCRNSSNLLVSMKSYSVAAISRATVKDVRTFHGFVEYFKHYELLKPFLHDMLDEIIELLKFSESDYLSEMYQIFIHLIDHNGQKKALEIYHRLGAYLNSEDFVNVLLPFYLENEIVLKEPETVKIDIYDHAYQTKSGRAFLRNEDDLIKYLRVCKVKGRRPSEFNNTEYAILIAAYAVELGEDADFDGSMINLSDAADLYAEAVPKMRMTQILAENKDIALLFVHMELEDQIYVVGHSEKLYVELLTSNNHAVLIKNMKRSTFQENYEKILRHCISLVGFEPTLFIKFIIVDFSSSDVVKQNLIHWANYLGISLVSMVLPDYANDAVLLSYLLTCNHKYTMCELKMLIANVKEAQSTSLTIDANTLLMNTQNIALIKDFVAWAIGAGAASSVEKLVEAHYSELDQELLWNYLLKTSSANILQFLYSKDSRLLQKLYDAGNFELVGALEQFAGTESVLIAHPRTIEFILANYTKISSRMAAVGFAASWIAENTDALKCLLLGFDYLIRLRAHAMWSAIKLIIIEGLPTYSVHQVFLNYIVRHVAEFSGDSDIFAALFKSGAMLSTEQVEELAMLDCEQAVDLLQVATGAGAFEVLPLLPVIVPLFISHKREILSDLFCKYGNLLATYTSSLARDYPEMVYALIHADPRHTLPKIISIIEGEDTSEKCIALLNNILASSECSSTTLIAKMLAFLQAAAANPSSRLPDETHKLFAGFYIRSFGIGIVDGITNYIACLMHEKRPVFHAIIRDCIALNCDMFSAAHQYAIESITSGDSEFVYFVYKYVSYRPELAGSNLYEQCAAVLAGRSEYMKEFLTASCRADVSVANRIVAHILKDMTLEHAVTDNLVLLEHIFKSVAHPTFVTKDVRYQAMLLAESKNNEVAEAARGLYEVIQFSK